MIQQIKIGKVREQEEEEVLGDWGEPPQSSEILQLQAILSKDAMCWSSLSPKEKFVLVKCRHFYKELPTALYHFLAAVEWFDPRQVREAHRMLQVD